MRMRRKKHLEERLADFAHRYTNMRLDDKRFGLDAPGRTLDVAAVFGNDHPVELEIGCGKGGFICDMAELHPEKNFLAVEKYGNVLISACELAEERGLHNVWFLWGDAEYLPVFLPAGCVTALYLNFSTPFPKKRAASHRLTHRHFLEIYRRLLVPGGTVVQKTDDRGLFQFSLEEFSQSGYILDSVSLDLHADDIPDNVMTEYERRFVAEGLPIYRAVARLPK